MPKQHRLALTLIVVAVLAWGLFHAAGTYLNFEGAGFYNALRPLIVIGCVVAFLGFWGLMLASRSARLKREGRERDLR